MNTPDSQNMQDAPAIAQPGRRALRINGRAALYILALLAPLAWAALLLYTRFVPPQGALAFAVFFILLDIALTSTLTPLAYVIGLRLISPHLYRATMRHALRQGALLALLVVFNLLLRALNSWSIFTAIVSLAIVIVIEVLALARK
jgi:hypothetical protein